MTEQRNDGGPAFPVNTANEGQAGACYPAYGLSMRDYFAAKAMQGLMANPGGPVQQSGMSGWAFTNCNKNDVAALAYVIADAMLKAREQ
jgi:hypothetical protein